MAKIVFRQKAIDDLSDIWNYTVQEWSEKQADHYYKLIQFGCNKIAQNTAAGKKYENINDALFGLKSGKHIIFYQKISKDLIEIVRILHERMDLENRINE
ncbi:type II toxin-antitoxin system RelE/ParE family toxin [uncultured Kordia sp.]|uniref:type II toxin-antitoxin system RelE/ParE family toxin n=1 Tax=uncultured Kordia sp. TaxID=507699 RepID=UPI00260CF8D1|nr:type II toxin-antitoxin system RelE/ParE family toxin [uncultured Kordia sp.]